MLQAAAAGWVSTFCWHTLCQQFYGLLPMCFLSLFPPRRLYVYLWEKSELCTLNMQCLSTLFSFSYVFFFFSKWATCSYFLLLFFSLHRDLLRIGVTLAGHQKKILGSIQDMRLQMNQTLPVQVWSNRTETDAVKGQPDRKMGELYQREPLENPSCLTHLCQLVAMKLACSASDYFFSLFHY